MIAGTLPRRLVVGGLSAALVAGGLGILPLLSAQAAACPSWTDPAGDSGAITPIGSDPSGVTADDDLDITSTTVATDAAGGMQVTVVVKGLKDAGPDLAAGEEFSVEWTTAGTDTTVTLARDTGFTGDATATLDAAASADGKAVFDLKTSTVTGTFTPDQVKTAFGKPVAGLAMTGFQTLAYGYTRTPLGPALGFPEVDEATAPAAVAYTDAGGCSGAAPSPAGSGTPVPSQSVSPGPSPTATGTASPSPSPTASGPAMTNGLFDQPRKGCVTYKDAASDADPTGTGLDNEPALDVTQVNLKSPSGALQVLVGLTDPSAGLFPLWDGPVWSTSFTVGGKKVTLTATGTGPADATVGTAANKDIKATAKVDTKAKNIVFTVPLAGLSKAVGTTVKRGTPITGTAVETAADSVLGPQTADTAAGTKPEEKTYAYGDNHCFVPPPGKILIDADRSGQYGDRTHVLATLLDEDDTPVAGVNVTALISGGRAVLAKTDSDGIADLRLPLTMAAGSKTLYLTYAGDREVGRTRATKPFVVTPERAVLRLYALRGGAQANVVDDDRPAHAVVGRYVRFTIGSKSYLRKTSSRGIAVLTGVRKGTLVKVTFLPVRGLYLGTKTYAVRAR